MATIYKVEGLHCQSCVDKVTGAKTKKIELFKNWLVLYYPLLLILSYVVAVSFVSSITHNGVQGWLWMKNFMAGFFLVFSAFKLLDLPGFANAFATYDLLARRSRLYAFIYPFLELGLGFAYLVTFFPIFTNLFTLVLMIFSSIGVTKALLTKGHFQCACLGTLLKVPISSLTLFEDLLMAFMAAVALFTLIG